eukprot:CAMPEP_0167740998 /NCGR_PEP_ID=MMETSP0110_2-20121227/610_1 /TAXON_ID=629695 /ORGANISM="Gymnochlora sp., Strain CCMP2014" /LENGTH=978 /DNA_ID=CAMNT_0007624997 /DNA_START=28 /DNA_END=2964 /DNA_ORIENTATION=-
MMKTYLRFELRSTFGVICSPTCNAVYDSRASRIICGCLENVKVWNPSQGASVTTLLDDDQDVRFGNLPTVTTLSRAPTPGQKNKSSHTVVAAGYSDGSLKLWDIDAKTAKVTFSGHRSQITSISFNANGSLMASGSNDTEIVIWDPLAESGVCRLQGHKAPVTDLCFVTSSSSTSDSKEDILISTSKDATVKVWNVAQQFCVQTVLGFTTEVTSLSYLPSLRKLAISASDFTIRLYEVNSTYDSKAGNAAVLTQVGQIKKQSKQRVSHVQFESSGLLLCVSKDKMIEVFKIRSDKEVEKRRKRREKRRREKEKTKTGSRMITSGSEEKTQLSKEDLWDLHFHRLLPIRTTSKVRSATFSDVGTGREVISTRSKVDVLVTTLNNQLQVYTLDVAKSSVSTSQVSRGDHASRTRALHQQGHRGGIRSISLSSDDEMILTTSSSQAKVWNRRSGQCIRTLDTGYGLCGMFLPGNRHALVGTKTGCLELYDLTSCVLLENIKAHEGCVWSLFPSYDKTGLVTGGSDKTVKFWEYEQPESKSSSVGLVLSRQVTVVDEVLCVCFSSNGKYIAVGLLDSTVKVFFADTLKFYLSLYGHKLPVMCIDISSDSTLLASGGADKDLKIWGMDFGDCHKSFFAHDQEVTAVRFCPNTHYLFTCGKDKKIKFWDADKFQQVMVLNGHYAEVWSLAVGVEGNVMVSASNDRSVRVWEQTDEMVFVHLEQRRELEGKLDEEKVATAAKPGRVEGDGMGEELDSAPVATGTDNKSLMAAERLMEAMEVVKLEQERWDKYNAAVSASENFIAENQGEDGEEKYRPGLHNLFEKPKKAEDIPEPGPNPVLGNKSPAEYIFAELKRIPAAARTDALAALPFKYASMLIAHSKTFLEEKVGIEAAVQTTLYLANRHRDQLLQSREMTEVLAEFRTISRSLVRSQRDIVGENIAGLRHHLRSLESKKNRSFFNAQRSGTKREPLFVIDRKGEKKQRT